ncbi:MAG: riboflavin synthase [Bacteroidetes bacterium]|nr:riboflavin synthase [Bacteroidota bacterium]MDA1268448.1 riboflavin synthase [Bacteroidota bacterium]
MFTGIIEAVGTLNQIKTEGTNTHFYFSSSLYSELKVDQSLAHDGVCLTVVEIIPGGYRVTAIDETFQKTNLSSWKAGKKVNLERCMAANGRFDGHIVQGHVDQIGTIQQIVDQDGSWIVDVSYDASLGNVTVEKGSITLNGTSLTCFNSAPGAFSVAIIPYTYEFTNFHELKAGDQINLEFDIVGKYIQRITKGYL